MRNFEEHMRKVHKNKYEKDFKDCLEEHFNDWIRKLEPEFWFAQGDIYKQKEEPYGLL